MPLPLSRNLTRINANCYCLFIAKVKVALINKCVMHRSHSEILILSPPWLGQTCQAKRPPSKRFSNVPAPLMRIP